MAESKRTFQGAKMNKDIEEKILKPGEYRDALNISVDFSEDGNIGSIENLKGNLLIGNQDILGLSSTSNPNAEVIGSFPHPEENKIYYFVTGDKIDGIFEYDVANDSVNTVILDSSEEEVSTKTNFTFSQAGVSAAVSQNGQIQVSANDGTPSSLTSKFNANETGSAITQSVTVKVKVPKGYLNSGKFVIDAVSAVQATKTAPSSVTTENAVNITLNSARLRGSLGYDDVGVTAVGFYWGYNTGGTALTLSELESGGTGITRNTITISSVTGDFSSDITSLPNSKLISFVAFATNSVGTGTGAVKTFTTSAAPSINRFSGNEYVVIPVIDDDNANAAIDEIDDRSPGYGSFFKDSGEAYLNINAPSSDGLRANRTNVDGLATALGGGGAEVNASFSSNPSGIQFRRQHGSGFGVATIQLDNMAANTSYQITIPSEAGIPSKTVRINNGSPSGTYYTSTLSLNLSGVFVAKADIGSQYDYNVSPAPLASYILGPVASGEKAQCIIPLNNVNTAFTANVAQSFVSSFDANNLTVTVTGKTEGTDFDYYIEDTSTAIFGCVPGIIFEGIPENLGATPTVNITYTT